MSRPPVRHIADPSAAQGRMAPFDHTDPAPWVQLRNATFHTLIYQKMIGRADPRARDGDLVKVYDRDAKTFGYGLLNRHSQLALRMLNFGEQPVDESFLATRIAAAAALRSTTLALPAQTDAWRVVHAEGDGLPNLIVDRFGPYAVVELFGLPMFLRLPAIERALKASLPIERVVVRADQRVQQHEGFTLPETPVDRQSTIITENQVRFQVELTTGHKTGFFCDQRDNRRRLTAFTANADVLDMCCYSGGFGVYAAVLGRARHVTCVDLDEDAIELARRNANINQISRGALETVHADSFPYLRQMRQNDRFFDIVILDPPKLIPTRDDFAEGRQKYFDLNKLALEVIKPGGLLVTCSCSGLLSPEDFSAVLRGAARSAGRRVQILETTGAGRDHPVMTDCPEGAYLKCAWCRVFS